MKRPTILVDCDGVMVRFTEAYLQLLWELCGVKAGIDEVTDFSFSKCVATKEQDAIVWKEISQRRGFVYRLDVYEGVDDALAILRGLGRVVCVTSPSETPYWVSERTRVLRERFGFGKRDIVLASDKSVVFGDVLIDDAEHNLDEWGLETAGREVLIAQPWNSLTEEDDTGRRTREADLLTAALALTLELR